MAERRPRRTTAKLVADIHEAVIAMLVEEGYGAVTFEGVARRCAVSKPVLYRRYADRAAMVADALSAVLRERAPSLPNLADAPSRGSLRADLVAQLDTARRRAEVIGAQTYRSLVGEADDATLQALDGLGADGAQLLIEGVVRPARERGELGPEEIPETVLLTPVRVLRDQLIFGSREVDVTEIVDEVAIPLYRHASAARS